MSALEKHYTAAEVAKLWQLSPDTVRNIFRDYPGVLKLAQPPRRLRRGYRRSYVSIRIPESVLQKRHSELHGKAA